MKKILMSLFLGWILLVWISFATEDMVACTMEYAPVCAEVQVQCIKAPCPVIKETFGNKCMMNANKLAKFLYEWECKKGIDLSKCKSYFDGCNTCFVSDGKIGWCTKMYCENPEEPKCLVEQENNIDLGKCESYFDGCNNCSVVDWKLSACTLMYCETPTEPKCLKHKEPISNIANPASTFCMENSGTLEILNWTWWQYGICKFTDGSKCEEWKYFRWECKPEYKKIHNIFDKFFDKYAGKFQKIEDRKVFLEEFKFKIQSLAKWAKLWLKRTYNKIIQAIDAYR